jgi:hypothetical protein
VRSASPRPCASPRDRRPEGRELRADHSRHHGAAAAQERAGTGTLGVDGLRLVESARYAQIVGATTNRANAFPEPGAAVYTVLSGSFDRVP